MVKDPRSSVANSFLWGLPSAQIKAQGHTSPPIEVTSPTPPVDLPNLSPRFMPTLLTAMQIHHTNVLTLSATKTR